MDSAIVHFGALEALSRRRDDLRALLAATLAEADCADGPWAALEPESQVRWLGLADAALEAMDQYDDGLLAWLEDVEQTRLARLELIADQMRKEAEAAWDLGADHAGDVLRDFAARLLRHEPLPPRRGPALSDE